MEEASKAKKAKKGFMTPERKKKLRVSTGAVFEVDAHVIRRVRVLAASEEESCRGTEEGTGTQGRGTQEDHRGALRKAQAHRRRQ